VQHLERSFLYRADWTWQRTEEGLLYLRYYWWCVQAATLILLCLYRRYGLVAAIHGASVSSRHDSCHGWETTRGEPVSAVALTYALRDEAKQREWRAWQASFNAPPAPDIQRPYVTPFNDRDGDYFQVPAPVVVTIAPAIEGTIVDPMEDQELDRLWETFMERTPA
jgi:hypothetical protein